ncbi:hypothetical protein ACE10Z_01720 [Bradyrhizobium sp. Pha-3]|uniref:hypothetical protein n=1 Tax=Bradyrhizobium sp. Pha-3 TaxID=208375 RepID=UPI0035D44008
MFAIAKNPDVLAAAAAILRATPTIALMSVWWSMPRADAKPEHAENFIATSTTTGSSSCFGVARSYINRIYLQP